MDELLFPENMSHEDRMKHYFGMTEAMGGKSKKKQTPANKLTSEIIRYVMQLGGTARRVNVMGVYDKNLGKHRTSGMRKGFEDVSACIPVYINGYKIGVNFGYEVKIGKDKMSDDQEERKVELTSAGGVYIESKSMSQVISDTQDALAKIALGTNKAV
jgi:hypothetical protein